MKKATFPELVAGIDAIRRKNPRAPSNIIDYSVLPTQIEKKDCLLFTTQDALLLLVPYHDSFYDLLYCAQDINALKESVCELKKIYNKQFFIRTSITGKKSKLQQIQDVLEESNFILVKERVRTVHIPVKRTRAAMSIFNSELPQEVKHISFAIPGDEREIYNLLQEEFDCSNDNIPEIDEIKDSIEKKEIVISRKDDQIVALNYYKIKSHACYSYFDLTKKEYRHDLDYFELYKYRDTYIRKSGIVINKYIGWRDPNNKRLMKFIARFNEFPDDIYTYMYQLK